MGKQFIITEKPSVARDIASAFGGCDDHKEYLENNDYIISWAVGHLFQLLNPSDIDPKYKRWALADLPIIPEHFERSITQGHASRVKTLLKIYKRKDVDSIVNACDAGREGELIFREIYDYCIDQTGSSPKPSYRLWLQSMTQEAILSAFDDIFPSEDVQGLADAAYSRSEADWLIGINSTRALTKRMKLQFDRSAWSAGRVQTPTLALLVDRELERLSHRPEPFFLLEAEFQAPDHQYKGTWFDPNFTPDEDSAQKKEWVLSEEHLKKIAAAVNNGSGTVVDKRKTSQERAKPLFDLTSLQREANSKFGFTAKRTLRAAQRLYEGHKLITYPRTDSKHLPEDYQGKVDQIIQAFSSSKIFGKEASHLKKQGLLNKKEIFNDKKVSDHFAIIPTHGRPKKLEGDDARIYDCIVRRFLAAFCPPATWERVERITSVEGEQFTSSGRNLQVPGWYMMYGKYESEIKMPTVAEGEQVDVLSTESKSEETKPVGRYSEARLLTLMETAGKRVDDPDLVEVLDGKGLGTPATRADIIENLIVKEYARRAGRGIAATAKGIVLLDLIRRINLEGLASPKLTADMEMKLKEMEKGSISRSEYMDSVKEFTQDIVDKCRDFSYDELYVDTPPVGLCPVHQSKGEEKQVKESLRSYACEEYRGKKDETGCVFSIWKEKTGRYLDRKTVEELIAEKQTGKLSGFAGMDGQEFESSLHLDSDFKVQLENSSGAKMNIEDSEYKNKLCSCPFSASRDIYEIEDAYVCDCDESCRKDHPKLKQPTRLPKQVCKRTMFPEEAVQFFSEGTTEEFPDFTSKYGRPFKAKLTLKDNGRHGFVFAPREKKTTTKKAATKKKTAASSKKTKTTKTKKKTTAKKTTKKTT